MDVVQAQTADDKAEATQQAVERVRCSLEWMHQQTFLTPTQMDHWDHLVSPLCSNNQSTSQATN